MCGIAGFLGTKPLSESTQSSVLSSILHRGPDGSGIFNSQLKSNYLALFHTRLSIVDLDSRSAQPFAKHQFVLVYNGEIYNFIEIRKELEREGCLFSTGSDTEVVIEAFRVWGKDCVSRFEGMWAFALFDQKQQQVWLSRDRFGEKPLYYLYQSGNLYFASEIKALAVMLGQWPEINPDQVRRYLVNGFKSLHKSGQTWFRNVHEFPAASISLVEQPEAINPKKYWRLEYKPQEMTRDNAVEGVREHLLQAVSLRLRADVPIAFCLSGGVDSATLASIATKEFGQKIHTFSIVDRDERYNEIEEINDVVSDLNCDQHVVEIGYDGFWERMQRLVSAHDAPIATVSYYVHSFLSEAISENGYKVAISGTGADEIFTGYYDHYSFWLSLMKDRDDFDLLRKDWEKGYGEFVRNPLLKDPQIILQNPNERGHIYLNRDDFNRMLVDPIDEDFYEKKYSDNTLRNRMLNELFEEIVPVILKEDDLNSMNWSVENRSPYLDRKLAEFVYSVPDRHLIHNGFAKSLLRDAGSGYLTDRVRKYRQKKGFNASISSLVDFSDKSSRDRLLESGPIFEFIKRDEVEKILGKSHFSNSYSKFLFGFISARIFLDQIGSLTNVGAGLPKGKDSVH